MRINLKVRWHEQKDAAKSRGIEFQLTHEEWLGIWQASGKLHLRGQRHGQYVMGRHEDKGAYEVGNVSIIPNYENNAPGRAACLVTARLTNAQASEAQREARSRGQEACVRANTGAKRSVENRHKMSAAALQQRQHMTQEQVDALEFARSKRKGMKDSDEVKVKRNASNRGQKRSNEARARMRASRLAFLARRSEVGS